ncbi:MAG: TraV family lipoprotein [Succinivibrionaceae bacterium]|nr:TraV family lipoprotein [Succinivibrionaceae bacterium]
MITDFRTGASMLLALLAGGCSFLDIGENEYRCPGGDDGIGCASARDVYRLTSGAMSASPKDAGAAGKILDGQKTASGNEATADVRKTGAGVAVSGDDGQYPDELTREHRRQVEEAYIVPNLPDRPVPVRTPAGVMRIWVASWEDDGGDLNAPGYIYVEIEPRRWIIGEPERHREHYFSPLEK